MGKYEAAPKHAAGGGKKRIVLWIALAVFAVLVVWGIWFFTTPPEQKPVEMPPEQLVTPTQPSQPTAQDPQPTQEPTSGEGERQMKKAGTPSCWPAPWMAGMPIP